jgi:hypothetical protein
MYFLFGFLVFHIFYGLQSPCTKVIFILWESFLMLVVMSSTAPSRLSVSSFLIIFIIGGPCGFDKGPN